MPKVTTPFPGFASLGALLAGLLTTAGPALAQPDVSLNFEGMFGKRGKYDQCGEEDRTFCFQQCTPDRVVCETVCLCEAGTTNTIPPDGFTSPAGVDWVDAGTLMIADRGNSKLQRCGVDGSECAWIGGDSSIRNIGGVFTQPHGVEISASGLIGVADEGNHAVQVTDHLGGFRYSGNDDSQAQTSACTLDKYDLPRDVAFDPQGLIYAIDACDRIKVLRDTPDLQVEGQYVPGSGSGVGQLNDPRGIAIDGDGRIIIADTGNHRIQVCESGARVRDIECTTAFGSLGGAEGMFNEPIGVDVDALGRIWVADSLNHRIQVCDYAGACEAFGSFGDFNPQDGESEGEPDEGPLRFDTPHDVAWHPSGKVAVVDTGNHRIQIFTTEGSFAINAGLNDAWLNAEWLDDGIGGQGFFIVVFPLIEAMFLAHFTFDTVPPDASVQAILGAAGQRWVTAFGIYSGAVAVLDAELSTGGVFDSPDPAVATTSDYGTYTVEFTDCMNAVIRYDIPGLGLAGEIPVTRITSDNASLCEELAAVD